MTYVGRNRPVDQIKSWGERLKLEMAAFLDASRDHRKPVMIGEMTLRHVGVLDGQKSWDQWFGPIDPIYLHASRDGSLPRPKASP